MHIAGEKNVVADALSRLDADFDNKFNSQLNSTEIAVTYMTKN